MRFFFKRLGLLILLLAHTVLCQELISKDSTGFLVEVKEKYGCVVYDSVTVVMEYKNNFVLVHRDGSSAWYPMSFHSIRILKRPEE